MRLTHVAMLFFSSTSLHAQLPTTANAGQVLGPAAPFADRPVIDSDDWRYRQLIEQGPGAYALAIDGEGRARVRMDIYLGAPRVLDQTELDALVARFAFDGMPIEDGKKGETSESRPWTFALVSAPTPIPEGIGMTFFDVSLDLAIRFQQIEDPTMLGLTCSGSFAVWQNTSHSTGVSTYWYVNADMVSACAGPRKGGSADPDLYLAYLSGSTWVPHSSSILPAYPDAVMGYNPACSTRSFRVQVKMYAGGAYGLRVSQFNAN